MQSFDFKYTNPKYLIIVIIAILLMLWAVLGNVYGKNIGFLFAGIISSITGISIFYYNYRLYGKKLF